VLSEIIDGYQDALRQSMRRRAPARLPPLRLAYPITIL
jgi:hypothetical protein